MKSPNLSLKLPNTCTVFQIRKFLQSMRQQRKLASFLIVPRASTNFTYWLQDNECALLYLKETEIFEIV